MEMPPFYFETHFRWEEPWADWPEAFAIITAYATTGEKWTDVENQEADRALEKALRQRAQWVRRLTGFSPTTNHAEPGWAVAIGFDPACETGCKFRQDAIYYVTADTLYVSFCDKSRRELREIGRFRARVHLRRFATINHQRHMNPKSFISFAKKLEGERIITAGGRASFSVEVCESRLEFILESGLRRRESFTWVDKFCASFEESRSEHPGDYPETRNASYLIGLAREFQQRKV